MKTEILLENEFFKIEKVIYDNDTKEMRWWQYKNVADTCNELIRLYKQDREN